MGETDTNTWLAALSLELCEACPRPGAEGCRGWEACWGCVRIAAGTAEVGLLKVSVAAIASLWKERCAQAVSIHQPGAAVC